MIELPLYIGVSEEHVTPSERKTDKAITFDQFVSGRRSATGAFCGIAWRSAGKCHGSNWGIFAIWSFSGDTARALRSLGCVKAENSCKYFITVLNIQLHSVCVTRRYA
jgi:hypothetical protein